MKIERALGIIDAQRGFMPKAESDRLGLEGFGELPVNDGETIVGPINALIGAFVLRAYDTFTTQDWHPYRTAHFSDRPDFKSTWPRHCVAFTNGAELHPHINIPSSNTRFVKGFNVLTDVNNDDSYSGFNAVDLDTGIYLPEWLRNRNIEEVVIAGLALDYCVRSTALDLRQKLGLNVIVAIDATRGIDATAIEDTLSEFEATGVNIANTNELLESME